jgi:short-subunit dehydrogenase
MKPWVLITGASSGIGESLALEWAKRGTHSLILVARSLERLQRLAESCRPWSNARVFPLDLGDSESIGRLLESLRAEGIRPAVVVHNAGISQRSRVLETEMAVVRRIMEVNYFGTVQLTRGLLDGMIADGGGQFIVITSLVGKFGTPLRSAYSGSKHALHGFFDSLRAELGSQGVRVMMVCPGFIRTEISLHALTGSGERQGKMDEAQAQGMAPEVFARHLLRHWQAGREEVCIGGREVMGVWLKRWFPGLFSRLISRAKVT